MFVRVKISKLSIEIEINYSIPSEKLTILQSAEEALSKSKLFSIIQILKKWKEGKGSIINFIENLEVSETSIQQFPINMRSFVNLKRLFARNTWITEFPRCIFLPHLSYLYLSDNKKLRIISPEIGKLKELEHLDLSFTQIEQLPAEIGQVVKLKYLDLSYTPIKELPPEIGGLKELNYLSILFTQIKTLPVALVKLSLKRIRLHRMPHKEIVLYNHILYKKVRINHFSCFLLARLAEKRCIIYSDQETIITIRQFQKKLPQVRNYWHCFSALSQSGQHGDNDYPVIIAQACAMIFLVDLISSYCGRPFGNVKKHGSFFSRVRNYQLSKSTSINSNFFAEELYRDYSFLTGIESTL